MNEDDADDEGDDEGGLEAGPADQRRMIKPGSGN